MIKYLGSKRRLAPVIRAIADALEPKSALDVFTGTTRVAQELKRHGAHVTAVDIATYSEVLARCYVETDAGRVDDDELLDAIDRLNAVAGQRGYVTTTFCENARFFHPKNGARIDAIRNRIESDYRDSWLYPVLLTALLIAADRVDSTTGVQMAYLKQWAPRAAKDLRLQMPTLIPGTGRALRADATEVLGRLGRVDLAYVDPPYNQHRYFTNYHVWETLVRWDAPAHYGVACKRVDARSSSTKSRFNRRAELPPALRQLLLELTADVVVVSYNDESWVTSEQITTWLRDAGHQAVRRFGFDNSRYVGARIGIYSPTGEKVGSVGRLRNTEWLFVAGSRDAVDLAGDAVLRCSDRGVHRAP